MERRSTTPAEHRATGAEPPPPVLAYATPGEPRRWLDEPGNVARLVYALYGLAALLFVADILAHRHSSFAIEHVFGFYALYGLGGAVALVLIAKAFRGLLMRPEDYYDR